MFVLNLSNNFPNRKQKWNERIWRYLVVGSLIFVTFSLYSLLLITTQENSPHQHTDDILIVINNGDQLSNDSNEGGVPVNPRNPKFNVGVIEKQEAAQQEILVAPAAPAVAPAVPMAPAVAPAVPMAPAVAPAVPMAPAVAPAVPMAPDVAPAVPDIAEDTEEMAELSAAWGKANVKDIIESQAFLYRLPGEDNSLPVPPKTLTKRKNSIRQSMKLTWERYKSCAWGSDKLHPDSCTGSTWFGLGLTIIDSLDTLFLMGLTDELKEAADFISTLNFKKNAKNANIFEMTIRVLGALLTMANLTGEKMYLTKAVTFGDMLIDSGAFSTESGVPLSDIDLSTGTAHKPTCPGCSKLSSLSEVTTIQLEFNELTRLTGNPKYKAATDAAMMTILSHLPSDGLPKQYVDVNSGRTSGTISLGARSDSYYEYLLKQWIQTGNSRYEREYIRAVASIQKKLVHTSYRNLTYVAEILGGGKMNHKMDHLVCFLPGTLALGTLYGAPAWHLALAESIVRTCVEMYHTSTGLAPEIIKFDDKGRLYISPNDEFSLLRPETVESLFVLWRVTHNDKYRAWAWDIYSSMERNRHPEWGFSSMSKINTSSRKSRKDSLESFVIAETLKYLYLIHEPDTVLPFSQYVFNTEAHPFPVKPRDFETIWAKGD